MENYSEQIIAELYRAFDYFNSRFAHNDLPKPLITIQSSSKGNLGFFAPNRWKKEDNIHELSIHQKSFIGGVDEIMDTLLHEMAHIWNYVKHDNKVVDCSSQGRHNKIFERAAIQFGLKVSKSTRFGFGHTSLDEVAKEAIEEFGPNQEVFEIAQGFAKKSAEETKEQKEPKDEKRKSLVVGAETKQMIKEAAEQLGCSQKELADKAIAFYLHCINKQIPIPEQFRIDYDEVTELISENM